nr:hypothetical protein [Corynebacterium uropygiale]
MLILILIILAVVLLYRAFGPHTWQRGGRGGLGGRRTTPPAIKGPDDDPEFLWKLEQDARRRERERREQKKREQREQRENPEEGPQNNESG